MKVLETLSSLSIFPKSTLTFKPGLTELPAIDKIKFSAISRNEGL